MTVLQQHNMNTRLGGGDNLLLFNSPSPLPDNVFDSSSTTSTLRQVGPQFPNSPAPSGKMDLLSVPKIDFPVTPLGISSPILRQRKPDPPGTQSTYEYYETSSPVISSNLGQGRQNRVSDNSNSRDSSRISQSFEYYKKSSPILSPALRQRLPYLSASTSQLDQHHGSSSSSPVGRDIIRDTGSVTIDLPKTTQTYEYYERTYEVWALGQINESFGWLIDRLTLYSLVCPPGFRPLLFFFLILHIYFD